MDKQKMIEEMAKALAQSYFEATQECLGTECEYCRYREHFNGNNTCKHYFQAEYLYNAGYRKIHEGVVVLMGTETEECIEDLLVDFDEMSFYPATLCPNAEEYAREWKSKLIYVIGQLRKETAEKFAEMVSKAFVGLNCIDIDEWNWCQRKIDEICKEITEGKV